MESFREILGEGRKFRNSFTLSSNRTEYISVIVCAKRGISKEVYISISSESSFFLFPFSILLESFREIQFFQGRKFRNSFTLSSNRKVYISVIVCAKRRISKEVYISISSESSFFFSFPLVDLFGIILGEGRKFCNSLTLSSNRKVYNCVCTKRGIIESMLCI